ncbi:hypothetical protein, partial [Klebsiella pneumoniae]
WDVTKSKALSLRFLEDIPGGAILGLNQPNEDFLEQTEHAQEKHAFQGTMQLPLGSKRPVGGTTSKRSGRGH